MLFYNDQIVVFGERLPDLIRAMCSAKCCDVELGTRGPAADGIVGPERTTCSDAIVGCSWKDKDVVELAAHQDLVIGNRVQCYTTGKTELIQTSLSLRGRDDMGECIFQLSLNFLGEVDEPGPKVGLPISLIVALLESRDLKKYIVGRDG